MSRKYKVIISIMGALAILITNAYTMVYARESALDNMQVDMVAHNIVRCKASGSWYNFQIIPKPEHVTLNMDRIEGDYAIIEVVHEDGTITFQDVKINK